MFFSISVVFFFDSVLIVSFVCVSIFQSLSGRAGVQIYKNYAIPSFAYVGSAFSYVDY